MSDNEKLPSVSMVLGGTKGQEVRGSHVHVHEARLNSESGKMEYSMLALIPKGSPDIAAIKKHIEQFKKDVWTSKGKKLPPGFWNPLKDGDEDTKQDGSPFPEECKGHYLLNCKTDTEHPPKVVGTTKGEDGKFKKLPKSDIKSGDYFRVSVNLKPYTKGTSGVGAYLKNVQLVREGEALTSQTSAEDDFSDFDDSDDGLLD